MNITAKIPITAENAKNGHGACLDSHNAGDILVDAPAVVFGNDAYDHAKSPKGQGLVLFGNPGYAQNRFGVEMASWGPKKRLHDTNIDIPDTMLNMHDFHERGRLLGAWDLPVIEEFISKHPKFRILPSIYYQAAKRGDVPKVEALAKVVGTFSDDLDEVVFGQGYPYLIVREITPFTSFGWIRIRELLTDVWKWASLSGSVAMMECMDRLFHDHKPGLLDIVGAHEIFCAEFNPTSLGWLFPNISEAIEEENAIRREREWGDIFKHKSESREEIVRHHALEHLRFAVAALNKPLAKWLVDAFPTLSGETQLFEAILTYNNAGIPQLEILDELMDREDKIAIPIEPLISSRKGRYTLIPLETLKWLNERRPGKIVVYRAGILSGDVKMTEFGSHILNCLKKMQPQTHAYLLEHGLVREKSLESPTKKARISAD